jgi:hypothetical protein
MDCGWLAATVSACHSLRLLLDRVIMVDALHHVFHQQQTAAELWRVLSRAGGW